MKLLTSKVAIAQCACDGDRTVKYNSIRDIICDEAYQANLAPQKEKQRFVSNRRPADVFMPKASNWEKWALDIAVVSGLEKKCGRKQEETQEQQQQSMKDIRANIWIPLSNAKRRVSSSYR